MPPPDNSEAILQALQSILEILQRFEDRIELEAGDGDSIPAGERDQTQSLD